MAILVILYGLWQRRRWSRAIVELREISHSLEISYGSYGHRHLYHSFEHIIQALLALSKQRPVARWVLEDLRPVVAQYHHRAVVTSAGAWDEIRNAYLERRRHPVRVMRAAAGWVVLIGLAGTVLGFMEALPSLREVLASQANEIQVPTNSAGEIASGGGVGPAVPATADNAEQADLTARKLYRVLDSLQGVFLATFAGVIFAFLLSGVNLIFLEPTFDRFADALDALGARWFEPLIQAPDTLVDDALRGELRSYFDEIGRRLETVLSPLIKQLSLSLEQMSGLAVDFSGNIRTGVATLQTFHAAVRELGGSAQGAVDQLVQIVKTSGDFVREVESLQQKGLEELTDALSGPTELLANSAAAIDTRIQALEGQISLLSDASKEIAAAIGEHSRGGIAIQEALSSTLEAVRYQAEAGSSLQASVDSTARNLRNELAPLFAGLTQELSEVQKRAAQENRSVNERVTAGIESIRGMLATLEALVSPERIQEERRALEALMKAINHLSHQLEQQAALRYGVNSTRLDPTPQKVSLDQVQPSTENRALPRPLIEQRAGKVIQPQEAQPGQAGWRETAVKERPASERAITRLLRWLGFARFPKGRDL